MRQFDRAEPATITWTDKGAVVGNGLKIPPSDIQFLTFEEAVRYFVSELPPEERDLACITTASNGRWFPADLAEILDESHSLRADHSEPTTSDVSITADDPDASNDE